jgi:hypothetical protein
VSWETALAALIWVSAGGLSLILVSIVAIMIAAVILEKNND